MSNNPQWKMFQPPESHSSPLHDILDLQHTTMQSKQTYRNGSYSGEYPSSPRDGYNKGGGGGGGRFGYGADACPMGDSAYSAGSTASSNYESSTHPPIRETGIIEKLLHSYGFIQCCERQARLFFHFSQFSGNTEHLKIGDPVEFEMTYDRRTGKPIASTVTKIAPEVVLSEARVTGTVTTEVKGEGSGDNTGRISYENRGECFFLPYTKDDVEGNVVLRTGDAVSFQIATNQRGTLGACHVRFENPQHPVKYHGVVCSMKENFGFIERADVVKEIFFHYSEAKTEEELTPGDDVEFLIQTRNGKEVACDIRKLPGGSVVFEDVSPETLRGQVLKPLERGGGGAAPRQSDPLPGRIRYRAPDHSEVEVPFGDKDQCGEFTLRHGDWVRFQVATDRRDRLRRATDIALLDESFSVSGERRERGVVRSLRDGFGYLRCVERERPMLFRFAEVLRLGRELSVGDEVEFTVDPPATFAKCDTRQSAVRIKHLPAGSVAFETLVERAVRGTVAEAHRPPDERRPETPTRADEFEGLLVALVDRAERTLPYRTRRGEPERPRPGDRVAFDLYQVKRTKELVALGVHVTGAAAEGLADGAGRALAPAHSHGAAEPEGAGAGRAPAHGYIAALKDGFGFIETADHSKEVFFHFSNLEGAAESLEPGAEVEYARRVGAATAARLAAAAARRRAAAARRGDAHAARAQPRPAAVLRARAGGLGRRARVRHHGARVQARDPAGRRPGHLPGGRGGARRQHRARAQEAPRDRRRGQRRVRVPVAGRRGRGRGRGRRRGAAPLLPHVGGTRRGRRPAARGHGRVRHVDQPAQRQVFGLQRRQDREGGWQDAAGAAAGAPAHGLAGGERRAARGGGARAAWTRRHARLPATTRARRVTRRARARRISPKRRNYCDLVILTCNRNVARLRHPPPPPPPSPSPLDLNDTTGVDTKIFFVIFHHRYPPSRRPGGPAAANTHCKKAFPFLFSGRVPVM